MKINRQPPPSLNEDVVRQDHQFWSKQVASMLGDWLAQDTSVEEICAFAEQVFATKDLTKFRGDPLFLKDENACKAFSKLRNSIAGLYAWRVQKAKSPEEQQRMIQEADFAFRQAFALCPSSPEAIFRYINLLLSLGPGRIEDALRIAATARKLNPDNGQFKNLVEELQRIKQQIQRALPSKPTEPPAIL